MKHLHRPRRSARTGEMAARVAVVLGLATAVGLLIAGEASEPEHLASNARCPSPANAVFTAL